jgi:hypothetical protein
MTVPITVRKEDRVFRVCGVRVWCITTRRPVAKQRQQLHRIEGAAMQGMAGPSGCVFCLAALRGGSCTMEGHAVLPSF